MTSEAKFSTLEKLLSTMVPDEPPKNIQSGNPQTMYSELASSDQLETGTWSCSVGSWDIPSFSVSEVMLILNGRIRLTDTAGTSTELGKGDLFFLPKGWSGRWETLEDMQKLYVIVY
ncbi:MAG: cupin domain-containing protein [Chloroflexota bacterium]